MKILLPKLRAVLPHIIANQIIGVQPMTGPVGQIFSMRYRYGHSSLEWGARILMSKELYNKFLRLNNRKIYQKTESIKQAGYPFVRYVGKTFEDHMECIDWCNDIFGKNGYMTFNNEWFFENKEDHALFILTWLE